MTRMLVTSMRARKHDQHAASMLSCQHCWQCIAGSASMLAAQASMLAAQAAVCQHAGSSAQ
jgi:hypothetical protein